jgi:hypothetical protein
MNTDRGERIRVHPCPSVVKTFARHEETFVDSSTDKDGWRKNEWLTDRVMALVNAAAFYPCTSVVELRFLGS